MEIKQKATIPDANQRLLKTTGLKPSQAPLFKSTDIKS